MSNSTLVFHNAKFDLQKLILAGVLERAGLENRVHDTECLSHLIDEHQKKDLKTLAVEILGIKNTISVPIKSGKNKGNLKEHEKEAYKLKKVRSKLKLKKEDGYHLLPREVVVPYALADAVHTLLLFEKLHPRLEEFELYQSEMGLVLVCLDMEAQGLRVDLDHLKQATRETNTSILKAEKRLQSLTGLVVWYPEKQGQATPKGSINPNSHQQLIVVLNERGLKVKGTGNEILKPLDDPLAQTILELREVKKLRDFLYAIDRERLGDKMHPNFRIFKPVTGRMAAGKAEE